MTAPTSLAAAVLDRCTPAPPKAPTCPPVALGPVEGNRAGPYVQAALDHVIAAVLALPAGARQHRTAREAFGLGVALKRAGLADRETWADAQLLGAVPWLNTPQYRATVKRGIAAGIAAAVEGLPDRDPPGKARPTPGKLHQAVNAWEAAALALASYLPSRRRKMHARVVKAVAGLARQHAEDDDARDRVEAACRIVALRAGCSPDTARCYLDYLRAVGLLDLVAAHRLTWLTDADGVTRPRFYGNFYALTTPKETMTTSDETNVCDRPRAVGGAVYGKASSDLVIVYGALWELRPGGDLDRALRGGGGGTRAETLRAGLRLGDAFTLAQAADAAGSSVRTIHRHVQSLVAGDPAMIHQVEAGGGRNNPATYAADAAAVLVHAGRASGLEAAAWERARQEREERVAALYRAGAAGRDVPVELVADVLPEDSAADLPDLVAYIRETFGAVATARAVATW